MTSFLDALTAIPRGTSRGRYNGRPYAISKTTYAGGKSIKLVAEELGGPDYISLNPYQPASGPLLKPCEMPAEKVIAFVTGVVIEG
ncbi:hypothetical protein [Cognatishimia sp. MH4019]|uniref:hypothetical protein n=1 Tax=Cognatishimia sp. MH4019 TaxID=2854030 RepID=UPI001CD715D9